jgi:sterol desaturase/sphingolipid hydroxylase (fatty acid hydroxylase superfamily)
MRERLRPAFRLGFFPLVMFGSLAVGIGLLERGVHPVVALLWAQLPAFALVIGFERIYPHLPGWNRVAGDWPADGWHFIGSTLTAYGIEPLDRLLAAGLAAWLAQWFDVAIWPVAWPLWAQLGLALVVGELFQYWVHRLQHETDCLWRFHAVHHSAPRLYWLNAARFHPLDLAMNSLAAFVPLLAIGAGSEVILLYGLFSAVHGVFQHCNLDLRLGPLNWIFSMAELHRWHHSTLLREANHNYGQELIVWDAVFGTRFLPDDREPPEQIGIPDLPRFPARYLAHLASPFRWAQTRRESAAA